MSKVFTTSAGVAIGIQPVPPLLIEEVRLAAHKSVEVPPRPTYEVELPDGSKMTYEHDEKSVQTNEERAAWDRYQAALTRQSQTAATKVMDLFMVRGTSIDMPDGWQEMQEFFGLKLPTNPVALKIHYLRTELLTTTDDINNLMGAILEASGIDRNILQAAQNSFRGQLRQEQNATSGVGGTVQSEDARRQVVDIQPVQRVTDGESLGPDTIAVGQPTGLRPGANDGAGNDHQRHESL